MGKNLRRKQGYSKKSELHLHRHETYHPCRRPGELKSSSIRTAKRKSRAFLQRPAFFALANWQPLPYEAFLGPENFQSLKSPVETSPRARRSARTRASPKRCSTRKLLHCHSAANFHRSSLCSSQFLIDHCT